jgi:hypothetical protein
MTLEELSHTKIPFGPHNGKVFNNVDLKYLDSLVGQSWIYGDFKKRLEEYMAHPTIKQMLDKELGY